MFGGKTDCGLVDDVWAFDLTREAWFNLIEATAGQACVRENDPESCVAFCQ